MGQGCELTKDRLFLDGDCPASAMPTYSGGLGILAGDMIRAAADRELPIGGGRATAPQRLLLPDTRRRPANGRFRTMDR